VVARAEGLSTNPHVWNPMIRTILLLTLALRGFAGSGEASGGRGRLSVFRSRSRIARASRSSWDRGEGAVDTANQVAHAVQKDQPESRQHFPGRHRRRVPRQPKGQVPAHHAAAPGQVPAELPDRLLPSTELPPAPRSSLRADLLRLPREIREEYKCMVSLWRKANCHRFALLHPVCGRSSIRTLTRMEP
jgi:hypothetical protein